MQQYSSLASTTITYHHYHWLCESATANSQDDSQRRPAISFMMARMCRIQEIESIQTIYLDILSFLGFTKHQECLLVWSQTYCSLVLRAHVDFYEEKGQHSYYAPCYASV